ncbi:uncharacterized protein LOC127244925 [Andrographis paniculata]|uniref:uncharacterized protein LOC127244925 n=1 Tax=Andrographis paniculata TaxID=175694 RepID=UPI0021E6FA0A|nr:uncharacterized protein LOC127244925 [Andrographis paniculata]
MAKRPSAAGMIGTEGVRRRREGWASSPPSLLTRTVNSVFAFVRFAEFEILFVLFFFVAFLIFKDLTSRPEYNDIFVKKQGAYDWWVH